MSKLPIKIIVMLSLFSIAFLASTYMTPKFTSNTVISIKLEDAIPTQFGGWVSLEDNQLEVIAADINSLENKLYSQILERTYVNKQGQGVMLSIAYGSEQRKDMLAHFPEVCYPAQGFNIDSSALDTIDLLNGSVNVKHLKTHLADREEEVTYWVRVGDKLVASRLDQKLESIKYGLKGVIPDGLIFRISSIGESNSISLHEDFINDLFNHIDNETKYFLSSSYHKGSIE